MNGRITGGNMYRSSLRLLPAALALIATSPAVAGNKLQSLTPDDFTRKMVVIDSSLDTVAVISTIKGYRKGNEQDVFLRAGIDKQTGRTIFQAVGSIEYWGGWRFYRVANYATTGSPVQVSPEVRRNVIVCMSTCKYAENLTFDIDEFTLRGIASMSVPWRVRFSASNGPAWEEEMSPSEAAALLRAVDDYRSRAR